MSEITLDAARTIVGAAPAFARGTKLKPIAVVLLDARGAVQAALVGDGTRLKRAEIVQGKAHGALATGTGARSTAATAKER